jgi:hypothetical protein
MSIKSKVGFLLLRVGQVLGELVVELILVGVYFGILVTPVKSIAIAAAAIPVFAVLLSKGYYFTRPILGICWGSRRPWIYAILCGFLFLIHMYLGYLDFRSGASPHARAVAAPFLIGGMALVVFTAYTSRYWLRRWLARRLDAFS